MYKLLNNLNLKNIFLISVFILLGISISIHKGYGDDLDSYAMISTFLKIIEEGYYSPSRFYEYPIGELVYGFLAYFFGSFISSLISYSFFLASLIFIYKSFFQTYLFDKKLILFIILCFSNPVLFLDNTNPSDAPLSLFVFCLGFFFYKKKYLIYAGLFFSLAIATRANYGLFVYTVIFYDIIKNKKIDQKTLELIIICTLLTFLFYFPAFIINKFDITFITNPGGPDLNLVSLLPRFIYKTYLTYGVYSSILILLIYLLNFTKVNNSIIKYKLEFLIFFLNLLTFLFIPTKTSIISLSIILTYLIIYKILINKKLIYLLIFSNLIFYIFSYQIFEFKYKNQDPCAPIEAIDANIEIKFKEGYFFERSLKLKQKIKCDSRAFSNKSQNYLEGKRLK